MKEYLKFKKMISPVIIQIIFWVGVTLTFLGGLGTMINGLYTPYGGGPQVFFGLIVMIVGPLSVRVYCELLILFFRINDSVTEINDKFDIIKTSNE
mgnify:CR=1 FL=1